MTHAPGAGEGYRLGVVVEHDPAVWIPGPLERSRDEWLAGAHAACAADFGVEEGTEESDHLRQLLSSFVDADLGSDHRFLRLRALVDVPLTARLMVTVGAPDGEVARTLVALDDRTRFYDAEPAVETIDEERGLRRALAFAVGEDGIRSRIRYHRRVPEWSADFVLACAGADMRATAIGLPDLDELARAVWFVDAEGNRR